MILSAKLINGRAVHGRAVRERLLHVGQSYKYGDHMASVTP